MSRGQEQAQQREPQPHPTSTGSDHMPDAASIFGGKFGDINGTAFTVGILVGLVTLFLLYLLTRKRTKRTTVLIAGPCDAGKTLMFSQLLHAKPVETFASMQENSGVYEDHNTNKILTVVDLPGHDRLRYAALDKYKDSALAVLYVIDASTIKQQIRDAAEFLFRILSDPVLNRNRTPVLVACNKQDVSLSAKGAAVIEREVTKEIGLLRETHARLLDGTNDAATAALDHVFLGTEGKDFEFSDLKAKVQFCETSAATDVGDEASGMQHIEKWLSSLR